MIRQYAFVSVELGGVLRSEESDYFRYRRFAFSISSRACANTALVGDSSFGVVR
jgi:hypothetical protein